MPRGFLTLAPANGAVRANRLPPTLFRVSRGRFCAPAVEPGDYIPAVTLEPGFQQAELVYAGIGPVDRFTLRVAGDGAWMIVAPSETRRAGRAGKPLRLRIPENSAEPSARPLKGVIEFPRGSHPDLTRSPLLVGAATAGRDGAHVAVFAGAVKNGQVAFSLSPGAGPLQTFWLSSDRWALGELREAAGLVALAAPATVVSGRVVEPSGKPFRPAATRRGAPAESLCWLRFESLSGNQFWEALVDDQGRFEVALPSGLYEVSTRHQGAGFRWSVAPGSLVWVGSGKPVELEVSLLPSAEVGVEHADFGGGTAGSDGGRRVVLGFREGTLDGLALSAAMLNDSSAFQFVARGEDAWVTPSGSPDGDGSPRARAAPGRYDVLALELGDAFRTPWARVVDLQRGVELKPEARTTLHIRRSYPEGDAELSGTVVLRKLPELLEIRRAPSMTLLYAMAAPRIDIYDAAGRRVASAFASIRAETTDALQKGVATGDLSRLRELLLGRARDLRIRSLAPGSYQARIIAAGYPERRRSLSLKPGETVRWELDLDAPEP